MKLKTLRVSRDTILFATGLAGIAYETISGRSDAGLLVIFGGMVGLPAFIRTEDSRKDAAVAAIAAVPPPAPPPPVTPKVAA